MMDRLKRLAERHPGLRLALVPLRLKIALSYYMPRLGAIARWVTGSREYTNFTYEYRRPASAIWLTASPW